MLYFSYLITKISNRNIEHTYLHVHVEGGLAVVLLPPARAPRGSVHAARLHAPSHRDTCPAHTCRDKGTRVSSSLNNTCPDSLSTCHYSLARSQEHVSCLPVTNLVSVAAISIYILSMALSSLAVTLLTTIHTYFITHLVPVCHHMSLVTGHLLSWSYE